MPEMKMEQGSSRRASVAREDRAGRKPSEQARLLELGALAVSAGLTVAHLKQLAEARQLHALACAMRAEAAGLRAWVEDGAHPGDAPARNPLLDTWQAEFSEAGLAKA